MLKITTLSAAQIAGLPNDTKKEVEGLLADIAKYKDVAELAAYLNEIEKENDIDLYEVVMSELGLSAKPIVATVSAKAKLEASIKALEITAKYAKGDTKAKLDIAIKALKLTLKYQK